MAFDCRASKKCPYILQSNLNFYLFLCCMNIVKWTDVQINSIPAWQTCTAAFTREGRVQSIKCSVLHFSSTTLKYSIATLECFPRVENSCRAEDRVHDDIPSLCLVSLVYLVHWALLWYSVYYEMYTVHCVVYESTSLRV